MNRMLLDTNHAGAAVAAVSRLRDRLKRVSRQGRKIGFIVPVLCELEVGIRQRGDAADLRRRLRLLLNDVKVWPLEPTIASAYAEVHEAFRRAGRVVSQVDMLLAAYALHHDLTILTTDRDFEALPDVKTENWLA